MEIQKQCDPSATYVVCNMRAGEKLSAESGAFMASKGNVSMNTTTRQKRGGGFWQGLKRMVSGESFFINEFTAHSDSLVLLSTPLPGDMMTYSLTGNKLIIQGGSFVACESGVEIDLEWQGIKSVFSGESLFWVKAQGVGQVIVNSFGFIYPIQVDGEYLVDTSHIVAFEETLNFKISKATRGIIQSFLSGEGFVCRFKGKGTVWCQSHSAQSFGQTLTPHLRIKRE